MTLSCPSPVASQRRQLHLAQKKPSAGACSLKEPRSESWKGWYERGLQGVSLSPSTRLTKNVNGLTASVNVQNRSRRGPPPGPGQPHGPEMFNGSPILNREAYSTKAAFLSYSSPAGTFSNVMHSSILPPEMLKEGSRTRL